MSERMSERVSEAFFERLRIVARGKSRLPAKSAEDIIEDWRRAREAEARLYAALRKCLEEIEVVEQRDQHPTLAGDLARDAIAKAEGR